MSPRRRRAGVKPLIIALKNETDRTWDGFEHVVVGVGDFAAIDRLLEVNRIERVVMSGGVSAAAPNGATSGRR
jgi:DUF1009 family protein